MRSDQSLDASQRDFRRWEIVRHFEPGPRLVASPFSGNERDHLFLSDLGRRFDDLGGVSGIDAPGDGRCAALFDYDRDGWTDLAVASTNKPLLNLYRRTPAASDRRPGWIALRFVGGNRRAEPTPHWSNRDGVGVRVEIQVGERTIVRERQCGEGLAAQNSATLLVGLGAASAADRLSVRWPSGRTQNLGAIPAGTLAIVYEDATETPEGAGCRLEPYRLPSRAAAGAVATEKERAQDAVLRIPSEAVHGGERLRLYVTMATWCNSCKRAAPRIAALRQRLETLGVGFYGVPVDPDDDPDALEAYRDRQHPPYRLLANLPESDRERFRSIVQARLGDQPLPSSILTNAEGRVLEVRAGVPTVSSLRAHLHDPGQ